MLQSKVKELFRHIFHIYFGTLPMKIFFNKFYHFQLLYRGSNYKPIQRFHLMHLLKYLFYLPKQG